MPIATITGDQNEHVPVKSSSGNNINVGRRSRCEKTSAISMSALVLDFFLGVFGCVGDGPASSFDILAGAGNGVAGRKASEKAESDKQTVEHVLDSSHAICAMSHHFMSSKGAPGQEGGLGSVNF